VLEKIGRTRKQAGSGTNLVKEERKPEQGFIEA